MEKELFEKLAYGLDSEMFQILKEWIKLRDERLIKFTLEEPKPTDEVYGIEITDKDRKEQNIVTRRGNELE